MKDKKWAQREVDRYLSYEGVNEAINALVFAKGVINQLDEPEVTLDRAFEKIAESYPMTKEEIWRHLEQLEAYGGKVTYGELDEPEVLSQELPVIPKYVADWIEEERGTMSNWKLPNRFISDSKYKKDHRRYKWSQVEGNMDKFMSALINGYEVEKEPLFYAKIKGHELIDSDKIYWIYDKFDKSVFINKLYLVHVNFLIEMSKEDWANLGINDSNADFVKMEVAE